MTSDLKLAKIGQTLYRDVIGCLEKHSFVALLGPRHGAKTFVLEQLQRIAEAEAKSTAPCIVPLIAVDLESLGAKGIVATLTDALGLNTSSKSAHARPLAVAIVELLSERLNRHPNQEIWLFFQDLIVFPRDQVFQVLGALDDIRCNFPSIVARLSVVMTGSAELLPLCHGPNALLPSVVCYIAPQMDAECAFHYVCECRRRIRGGPLSASPPSREECFRTEITEDAFRYLYEQSSGSAHLMQELLFAVSRPPFYSDQVGLDEPWRRESMEHYLDHYLNTFMAGDYYIRQTLFDVEADPAHFDLLMAVLNAGMARRPISDEIARFVQSGLPHPTEVNGILSHRPDGTPCISSPLLERFLQREYSTQHVADVYALQGRWNEVRKYCNKASEIGERPLSGPAGSRLRQVIQSWRNRLLDSTHKNKEAVTDHFLWGMKHLYGFTS